MKKVYIGALLLGVALLLSCVKENQSDCVTFCNTPWIKATIPDGRHYRQGDVMPITWEYCGVSPYLNKTNIIATNQSNGKVWKIAEAICVCNDEPLLVYIPKDLSYEGTWRLSIFVETPERPTDQSKKFIVSR